MSRKPPDLRRAYLNYNRKYFNNRLPTDIPVRWEKLDPRLLGYARSDEKIAINAKLSTWKQMWHMTLLHEMCHIKCQEIAKHGKQWKAEMRRIAKEGAFDELW